MLFAIDLESGIAAICANVIKWPVLLLLLRSC
jgi:hypothetical protein